ncbi:Cyclin [Parasponia andersonii]|uniref:B-like cyclin n=1 Tax=Parasponia andersonii TaxID=3476 RepID=A0A2P5B8Z8_PARAD|nr:Cyclin [Parasponia andersonii]
MLLKLDYDPNNPLPHVTKPGLGEYLNAEAWSTPHRGYIGDRVKEIWRQRAVTVIFKFSKCENFDPVTPYLAMNYFDRYVSRRIDNPIPSVMSCRQHDLELLALCCLTLAWKMRDRHFTVTKFLVERQELSAVTKEQVLSMEFHILMGLDWRMRPVTALCFVRYMEPKFHSTYGFRRRTINQIIIQSQSDIAVALFRPSVIAVSALLAASSFLYTSQFPYFLDKVNSEIIFEEGHVDVCMAGMINLCDKLKLMIESAVPEEEYLPKKRVQAGTSSQQATEVHQNAAANKLKQVAAEPSRQASQTSKKAASPKLKQVVPEPYEQSSDTSTTAASPKLKQVAVEPSEQVAVQPYEQAGAGICEEGIVETPEQAVTDRSEQEAAETSEKSKQEVVETAERSEQIAEENSEQVAAEKSKKASDETAEKSEHDIAETSKEVVARKSEQVVVETSRKSSPEKSYEGLASTDDGTSSQRTEPSETVTRSEETNAKNSEQVAAEKSEQAGDEMGGESKHEVAETSKQARKSKQVAVETSQQGTPETTDVGTSSHRPEPAETTERSEQTDAKKSEQVAAEKSLETDHETAEKSKHEVDKTSKQGAAMKSKQVAAETSQQGASEKSSEGVPSNSVIQWSQRPGKEKAKEVEMTEIPKTAEDSNDTQFAFRLRWVEGEDNDDDFVIFSSLFESSEPGQGAQVPAGANQVQQHSQLHLFCDFCCCCSCCNPF